MAVQLGPTCSILPRFETGRLCVTWLQAFFEWLVQHPTTSICSFFPLVPHGTPGEAVVGCVRKKRTIAGDHS